MSKVASVTSLDDLWARWLKRLEGHQLDLREGAQAAEIAHMEAGFGFVFNPEIRRFFELQQGQGVNARYPALDPWWTLSFEELLEIWTGLGNLVSQAGVRFDELRCQGPVRALIGTRGWVPFADMGVHRVLCFDFEPDEGGQVGQVIEIELPGPGRRVVASSLNEFLSRGLELPPVPLVIEPPGRTEQLWEELMSWLERHSPTLKQTLAPGAEPQQIYQFERRFGRPLPRTIRCFFGLQQGQTEDAPCGLFDHWELLSLGAIRELWEASVWGNDEEDQDLVEVQGPVKPVVVNPLWLPFAHDHSGNCLCFDLDPAAGGQVGQVIEVFFDTFERRVLALGLDAYLEDLVHRLESGQLLLEDAALVAEEYWLEGFTERAIGERIEPLPLAHLGVTIVRAEPADVEIPEQSVAFLIDGLEPHFLVGDMAEIWLADAHKDRLSWWTGVRQHGDARQYELQAEKPLPGSVAVRLLLWRKERQPIA